MNFTFGGFVPAKCRYTIYLVAWLVQSLKQKPKKYKCERRGVCSPYDVKI